MTTEIRWRRGTAAQHATFTGALGEITVDTTNNRLIVHDGGTPGGFPAPSLVGGALPVAQGGTGATTQAGARAALLAAKSGANSDITSLTALSTALSIAQGGTGAATQADARTTLGVYSTTQTDAAIAAVNVAQLQSISASVGASALTLTLNPTKLDFRKGTLADGTPSTVSIAVAASIVVPNGATLGTINAVASRLVLLAINNGGTIEAAVTNLSGGTSLDETGLITTVALSAASDSANVFYSTTARTGVAYRVVGFIDSTQATAGVWGTAPTLVQGAGGQALAALSSLGYGQTWQNLFGSRTLGTTYYNTTGKPIVVNFTGVSTAASLLRIVVNGANIENATTGPVTGGLSAVVPVAASYVCSIVSGTPTLQTWVELR